MGSKEGRHGQEGMTTVPQAEDGYGQAENRLTDYDREVLSNVTWQSPASIYPLTALYWHFLDLCYTLTASIDILRDIFEPSHGLYNISWPLSTLLTASIDTLTASTTTLKACNRPFT
jgi:hypothetical protein